MPASRQEKIVIVKQRSKNRAARFTPSSFLLDDRVRQGAEFRWQEIATQERCYIVTPWKINMESPKKGVVQMIFLSNWLILLVIS